MALRKLADAQREMLAGLSGVRDDRFPDCRLLNVMQGRIVPGWPKVAEVMTTRPEDLGKVWYVERRFQLIQMISVGDNGLWYGWDTCGMCLHFITRCDCWVGLSPPAWIARTLAEVAKLPAVDEPPSLEAQTVEEEVAGVLDRLKRKLVPR